MDLLCTLSLLLVVVVEKPVNGNELVSKHLFVRVCSVICSRAMTPKDWLTMRKETSRSHTCDP